MRRTTLVAVTLLTLLLPVSAHASATKTFTPPWTSATVSAYCNLADFPNFVDVGDCFPSNDTDATTGRVLHTIDVSGNRRATVESRLFLENLYSRGGTSLQVEITLDIAELTAPSNSVTELGLDIGSAACDCHGGGYAALQDGTTSITDGVVTVAGTLNAPAGQSLPEGVVTTRVWISSHVVSSQVTATDHFVLDATLSKITQTRSS